LYFCYHISHVSGSFLILPIKFFSTHTELSLPGRQGNSLGCVILFIQRLLAYIEIFQSKLKEGKYTGKEKKKCLYLED
jgi:hypothetical protein